MEDMEKDFKLNDNDNKLLSFCFSKERSVNQISHFLNISPASVSLKLKKLEDAKLISVDRSGHGKKTYVRTIKGDETIKYFLELLNAIKQNGGEMEQGEYFKLLPFDVRDEGWQDKYSAPHKLLYTYPKLVKQKVTITKEGKKFLKSKNGK